MFDEGCKLDCSFSLFRFTLHLIGESDDDDGTSCSSSSSSRSFTPALALSALERCKGSWENDAPRIAKSQEDGKDDGESGGGSSGCRIKEEERVREERKKNV